MSRLGFLLLVISASMSTVANLLLRAGLDRAGGFKPHSLVAAALEFTKLLMEPFFAAGFVLLFVSALVWFRVITYEPLSTAYPLMIGLIFVMVNVGAVIVFRESMSVGKVIGLAVILLGIAIASASGGAAHMR
jgi:multidrug transporter EmrE-like cation transporter